MKKDVANIQVSIRARLENKAKATNRPFSELLQYYGMERFLYRFSRSKYADMFILKGALMFTAWNILQRRTTLDIDFLAYYENKIASIETAVRDICSVPVEPDGLVFDEKTVRGRKIKQDADYEGVRIKLLGLLDRARIPMQIDIGFGDIVYPRVRMVDFPCILDLPKPRLKGYPAESVISEKFEAMIMLAVNSRMKDFFDIWLMMRQFDFDGATLAGALKKTFTQRKTDLPHVKPLFAEEIYDSQSDRQILWKAFLSKSDTQNAPEHLSTVAKAIEEFLIKPLESINRGIDFERAWKAPGPWK